MAGRSECRMLIHNELVNLSLSHILHDGVSSVVVWATHKRFLDLSVASKAFPLR